MSLLIGLLAGFFGGLVGLGGSLAHVPPDNVLRLVFAAVLIWTGLKYLRTRPRSSPNRVIDRFPI